MRVKLNIISSKKKNKILYIRVKASGSNLRDSLSIGNLS